MSKKNAGTIDFGLVRQLLGAIPARPKRSALGKGQTIAKRRLYLQRQLWNDTPRGRMGMTRQQARAIRRRQQKEQKQAVRRELAKLSYKQRKAMGLTE